MNNISKPDLRVIHAALMARMGHLHQMKYLVEASNWRNAINQTTRLISEVEAWIRLSEESESNEMP